MHQTLTIARREITSLFFSPIAYVVLGLFALGVTWIFFLGFVPGQQATMRSVFGLVARFMIFILPAVSMRLLADETRSGTLEVLMTSPINDAQVVVGKWLGAMGFLLVLISPLIVLIGVMEIYADPDYGPIITGFVGLLLIGGLYLAMGTLASAATQNQIIAFFITLFLIGMFTIVTMILGSMNLANANVREAIFYLNVETHYAQFNRGLIDTADVVFFLSGIVLFLFLAVKLLESRRWR